MGVDRLLDGGGIVRLAIADNAQRADIHPLRHGRQVTDRRGARRRHGGQRLHIGLGAIFAHMAQVRHHEAIGEGGDLVGRPLARDRAAAVAEASEDRAVLRQRIFETDLREDILLVGDDDAGAADILEPDILAPQRVAIAAIHFYADGRVADGDIDHRQVDLMLTNGGVALPVEGRIDQRELPGGRGLFRDDAIAAALEMDILDDVAGLIDAGEAIPQPELHMAEKGMLRHAEAHARRGRIAGADLYVDVAHRRIEGARIGVAHHLVARHDGRHGHRHVADAILVAAAKDDHRRYALLETRRVRAQQDDRTRRADAIDAHAGGHDEGAADAIGARRQEDHAMARLVARAVERLLDRIAVVGAAVAPPGDRDGARFLRRLGKDRRARRPRLVPARQCRRRQQRRHDAASDHHRLSP